MAKGTFVTGDISSHTEESIDWLKENGATVTDCEGLSIIQLPDTFILERGSQHWQYTAGWKDNEDDTTYVEIQLRVNPNDTELYLHR